MNKTIIGVGVFVVGAAAGFFAGLFAVRSRYQALADEEIASVKEKFREMRPPIEKEKKPKETGKKEYADVLKTIGYSPAVKAEEIKPHVISPEEFGGLTGYEEVSLSYYQDGTLTNDEDKPLSDDWIKTNLGGRDIFTHFGEYEDDSVYVRNDNLRVDFEILREVRPYKEALANKPHA